MFGIGKREEPPAGQPRVSTRLCTGTFNGKYPTVGLYDCRERKVWVCKPLAGQAIRTSHARLITGSDNAVSTAWKDRFLCFWFYTPNTGEGYIHGYPIEWDEAQLLVRIDGNWDYDRQRLIPPEMEDQISENLERQHKQGERIFEFFKNCKLKYPFSLHLVGQRATDSLFYVKRVEAGK
ncbi:MAG TPA: hypothetical protein VFE47_31830 [Tepidisphaeraceae bacterium]|jgi:hypothetical protein|nr:hypothetical protein [Tepidisphaeraceae bacterium]